MKNPIVGLDLIQRNQYYNGKLLTAEDFTVEQEYMNLKRRILNRTMFGYGIVMGLEVVTIDGKEIVIKPGMAIDPSGREIIVPHEKGRISLVEVDGFKKIKPAPPESGATRIGLYIQYEETERAEDFSISSSDLKYRRINESYKLVVKNWVKPDPAKEEAFDKIFSMEDSKVLLGTLDITYLLHETHQNRFVIQGDADMSQAKKCDLMQLYSRRLEG